MNNLTLNLFDQLAKVFILLNLFCLIHTSLIFIFYVIKMNFEPLLYFFLLKPDCCGIAKGRVANSTSDLLKNNIFIVVAVLQVPERKIMVIY